MPNDTICALATPPGQAAIAVVRVSGPDALKIINRLFRGPQPSRQPSHTVRLGWIVDSNGRPVDQVLLTVFRAPRSYTGEDLAELSCHGGQFVADRVISLLLDNGCRPAQPGEFTRRAVLNRKMTLAQAEAVADLVSACTDRALAEACRRYRSGDATGSNGTLVTKVREKLTHLLAEIEYLIGFEPEVPQPRGPGSHSSKTGLPASLRDRLFQLAKELGNAARQAECRRFLFDGARVVITGRPNVGKSSLFNCLLGSTRAIVSPCPGTTRDTITAQTILGQTPVWLVDTAGILSRAAGSASPSRRRLNRLIAEHTRQEIERADFILAVFDGSMPTQPSDHYLIEHFTGRTTIYVINKSDRPRRLRCALPAGRTIAVSCRTGHNIKRLCHRLTSQINTMSTRTPTTGRIHIEMLRSCADRLSSAARAPAAEAAAFELREALAILATEELSDAGQLAEDLLNRVFARFCIGK